MVSRYIKLWLDSNARGLSSECRGSAVQTQLEVQVERLKNLKTICL